MHTPGTYQILLFNEVGSKRKTKLANSYIQALAKQAKFLGKHPTCSSVILLVMNNTRRINDTWGTDNETDNET